MKYKIRVLLFVAAACIVSSDVEGINIFSYSADTTDTNVGKAFAYRNDSITLITTDTVIQGSNIRSITPFDSGDSISIGIKSKKKLFVPSPDKAMWYGLIFPGLGQIYNRRYWKLPIVYGGFVGLAYGISWHDKYYRQYRQYYRDITDTNPNTKSYEELYNKYGSSAVTESQIKDYMDNLRRYRDLYIIGTVAFYAITVLDAFVDASLANFDISPDLSMRLSATMLPDCDKSVKPAMRLNISF